MTLHNKVIILDTMSRKKTNTRNKILAETWRLMEQNRGQGVMMSDIAKAAGISRQAVYLHFASRTELMIETINYVDEVKGLDNRIIDELQDAATGIERIKAFVNVWGNYIPEIYGLAKAMLLTRDTDEATAAAWDNSMGCLRDFCRETVGILDQEGVLAADWSQKEAAEMLYAMMSVQNWEQLTIECGWSNDKYIRHMKTLLMRTLIDGIS